MPWSGWPPNGPSSGPPRPTPRRSRRRRGWCPGGGTSARRAVDAAIRAETPPAAPGADTAKRTGRLVGLLPLYIYTQPGTGQREVFPLGIATTDYLDGLFAPGYERTAMAATLAAPRRPRPPLGCLRLPAAPPRLAAANGADPRGLARASSAEPCPILPLPGSVDELSSHIPPRMLHNLTYYRRRAEKAGEVRIEAADAHNWEEVLDALLTCTGAVARRRDLPGVLADDAVQAPPPDAARAADARQPADVRAAAVGADLAVFYGLADRPGPQQRVSTTSAGSTPRARA